MHFPLSFCKTLPPTFSLVHLLHRLYGVDAPVGRLGSGQWSNCGGTRGNGVPLPLLVEERRPLAYTMTATYNTSNGENVR